MNLVIVFSIALVLLLPAVAAAQAVVRLVSGGESIKSPQALCTGRWQGPPQTIAGGHIYGAQMFVAYQDPAKRDVYSFGSCDSSAVFPFDATSVTWLVAVRPLAPPLTIKMQPIALKVLTPQAAGSKGLVCGDPGDFLCEGPVYSVDIPAGGASETVYSVTLDFDPVCCLADDYFAGVYLPEALGVDAIQLVTDASGGGVPPQVCRTFSDFEGWIDLVSFEVLNGNIILYSEGYPASDPENSLCVNLCPEIMGFQFDTVFATPGTPVTNQIFAIDVDGDPISYQVHGESDVQGSISPTGLWSYTPTCDDVVGGGQKALRWVGIQAGDPENGFCVLRSFYLDVVPGPLGLSCIDMRAGRGALLEQTLVLSGGCDPFLYSMVSGPGSVDASGHWSYQTDGNTPDNFDVTILVEDPSEEQELCTFSVELLPPPVCGTPVTRIEMSEPQERCIQIAVDAGGGEVTCEILSASPGVTVDGNVLCYTPAADSTDVIFALRCTNEYGVSCDMQHTITFIVDSACVIDPIADESVTLCEDTYTKVISTRDPDGADPVACELVGDSPGQLVDGVWSYTPTSDGPVNVHIRCTNAEGQECEELFTIDFDVNDAPTCDGPLAPSLFSQGGAEVCVDLDVDDPDGDSLTCTILDGPGEIRDGQWCYTPASDTAVDVTIRCVDPCGASCELDFRATIVIAGPPECTIPNDTIIALCVSEEVCLDLSAVDYAGNAIGCLILSGPGSLIDGQWCYTPLQTEDVTVVTECRDGLGQVCRDSFTVSFSVADAPVCNVPNDTTIRMTAGTEVCLPVGVVGVDPADVSCVLVSGPGAITNGEWCYTPSSSETVDVQVRCTDDCGNDCEATFRVTFEINRPPVCNLPSGRTLLVCDGERVCLPVSATDPDGDLVTCEIVSGPGELDGGIWCLDWTGETSVIVTIACSDGLESCRGSFTITFSANQPPSCSVPNDTLIVMPELTRVCLDVAGTDPDDNLVACEVISGPGTIGGGQWCYTPGGEEEFDVTVRCRDACGLSCEETFHVQITMNRAPECRITPAGPDSLEEGGVVGFTVEAWDPDGDDVTVNVLNAPSGAGLTPGLPTTGPDTVTVSFDWVTDANGTFFIEFVVTDPHGAADTCTKEIAVTPAAPPQVEVFAPAVPIDILWDADILFCFTEDVEIPENAVTAHSSQAGANLAITTTYADLCLTVHPPAGGWMPDDEVSFLLPNTIVDLAGHCLDGNRDGTCNGGSEDNFPYTVTTALGVRPGDSNGDGVVDERDLLPLGQFWGLAGSPRGWVSGEWELLPGRAWQPRQAARADCNDDEVVDADDICPIVSFFGRGAAAAKRGPEGFAVSQLSELGGEFVTALYDALQACDGVSAENRRYFEQLLTEAGAASSAVPTTYALSQNYPNPFNAGTVIGYSLERGGYVQLRVHDILGRPVATLVDEFQPAGAHAASWNALSDRGLSLATGVYFFRLTVNGYSDTRRMVLLR